MAPLAKGANKIQLKNFEYFFGSSPNLFFKMTVHVTFTKVFSLLYAFHKPIAQ